MFLFTYYLVLGFAAMTIFFGSDISDWPVLLTAAILSNELGWRTLASRGFEKAGRALCLSAGPVAIFASFFLTNEAYGGLKYLYPIGVALNVLVMAANGGKMPIHKTAADRAGGSNYCLIGKSTRLAWLGGVFEDCGTLFSAGDFIILLALAFTVLEAVFRRLFMS